ncbi:MAG: ParA family protein [Candidatus Hydrogenedentes bacterium]|nr:ParA family protein [Candidatus Hydrogenedentota bacterium]
MIISFAFGKGGVGKSTLAHCLAFSKAFKRKYGTVALVDMDPQGTLAGLFRDRDTPPPDHVTFAQVLGERPGAAIKKLATNNGVIILDVPGSHGFAIKFAVAASDLVIVPARSSTHDEAALVDTLWPFLKDNQRPDLKSTILPVMVHPQSHAATHTEYFRSILPPELDVCSVPFPSRPSVYENYQRDGATLPEYVESVKGNKRLHTQAIKAVADIEAIAKELIHATS